jgi:competence protein ComEC
MKDKMTRPAIAVILGGFLAVYSPHEVRIFILAFLLLLLARCGLFWHPKDFFGRICKPEIILLVCSIVIGYFYGLTAERMIAPPLVIERIELEVKLTNWIIDDNVGRGTLKVQQIIKMNEETRVKADQLGKKYALRVYPDAEGQFKGGWKGVKPGDLLRLTGKLEHPQSPGTAGEFDLPLYNAVRGLSGNFTARGEAVVLAPGKPGIPWLIRQKVSQVLDAYWPAEAGVLEGILFGDTGKIAPETLEMYKAAGVMHVFAASGANVAFVIALAWGVFFFLPRKCRILTIIGVIILYAALCQGNPPILRAAILGTAVLLGMLGKGKMSSLRWLLFAALILFFKNPLYLKDTSFQLSFAATWGMLVLAPQLAKIRWVGKLPQVLRLATVMTLGAQLAALPIMIAVFHKVSLAGLLTNVFMLFILGAVLQLGLIGTVLILVPIKVFHLAFFQVAFYLLKMSDLALSLIASLPLAYFWVLNPGIFFWLLWYGFLGVLLSGRKKIWFIIRVQLRKIAKHPLFLLRDFSLSSKQRRFILCFLLSLGILWLLSAPFFKSEKLEITFLDVGQGDCILVETSREKLLVDSGPRSESFDAGERIVVPYLMEKRVGYLDLVFITHEDSDHLGGAKYVLLNIPTGGVVVPEVGDRLKNEAWQEGLPLGFSPAQGRLRRLKAGDSLELSSGLIIEVLAPVTVLGGTTADANNNSLVLLLDYLGWKVLLTGDMEQEEMQQISDRGADWDADFIKIPHHGSKGSLAAYWFDRTGPQAVFIQVGRNSFGHPAAEVIDYWQERGISIYRTDTQGTIRLVLDKKGFRIIPGRS